MLTLSPSPTVVYIDPSGEMFVSSVLGREFWFPSQYARSLKGAGGGAL